MAFKILYRTKNAFTEKTIPFGFIGTIVNGFRLEDFTTGTLQNLLGRCEPNRYLGKVALKLCFSPE